MGFPAESKLTTLEVYEGDTLVAGFVFSDRDGVPLNLSTWSQWAAQWRPTEDSDESVAFTVDTSQLATGRVGISLSGSQTDGLRNGVWDVQATRSGEIRTWVRGRVTVKKDVTRG